MTVTATEQEHHTLQMTLVSVGEEQPELPSDLAQPGNNISSYTFPMPEYNVEASVEYTPIMYTITVPEIKNGTVTLSYSVANADGSTTDKELTGVHSEEIQSGTTVTVTVVPDTGYQVNEESLLGYTVLPNKSYSFDVGKEKDVEISFELVSVVARVTYSGFGSNDEVNADLLKTDINLKEDVDGYYIAVPLPETWNSETTTITDITVEGDSPVLFYGEDSRYYVEGGYLYIYFDGPPEKEGTVELTVNVSQLTEGYVLPVIEVVPIDGVDLGVTYVVEKHTENGEYWVTVYDDKANTLGYELEFSNFYGKTNKDGDVSSYGSEIIDGITTNKDTNSTIKLHGGNYACSFKISNVAEAEKVTVTLNYVLTDFDLTCDNKVSIVDEDGEVIDGVVTSDDLEKISVNIKKGTEEVINATVNDTITVLVNDFPVNHTPYIQIVPEGEKIFGTPDTNGKYYSFTFDMPAAATNIEVFLLEDKVDLTEKVSYSAVKVVEETEKVAEPEVKYEPLTNANGEDIVGTVTSAIYNKVQDTLTLSFKPVEVGVYVAESIVNFMIGEEEVSGVVFVEDKDDDGNGVYTVTLSSDTLKNIEINDSTEITFYLVYEEQTESGT